MATSSTVAIIGLGNIGKVVAGNLAKSDRPFFIADRNIGKAKELAIALSVKAQPVEIIDALKNAEMLILAIPFAEIKNFLAQYQDKLEGKVIIDPSNPIAPDPKGGFVKVIAKDESAGEIISALLPAGAKLAKALGTLAAGSLAGAAFKTPDRAVLFYATSDRGIDAEMERLITDTGFAPVRVGGIDQSIRIEVFGDLHEFGALGKTVTVGEAKAKL